MNTRHQWRLRGLRTLTLIVSLTFFSSLALRGAEVPTFAPGDLAITWLDLDGFSAAQSGMPARSDSVLRGGVALHPPPICAWMTGDYGADKGRSYFEGGISTGFLFGKNSRYPVM